MDGIGAGVLVAAVLGAWLAWRATDGLGEAPDQAAGARAARKQASAGRGAPGGRAGAPDAGEPRGDRAPAARAASGSWSAPRLLLPESLDRGPRDWSGPIATGLAPPLSEEEAAAQLEEDFRRLGRDLEFSPGLPEPRQQRATQVAEPWRPDPEVEGRPPPVIESISPSSAPARGGAEVVIRGRNLRAAQVIFGQASARITRASPEQITVVVPPGTPGEVRVALTNDDGHFALAQEPFTLQR